MKNNYCKVISGLFILLAIVGCSEGVTYHAGIISTKVFGTIQSEVPNSNNQTFILVVEHNQTFFQIEGKNLTKISAKIIYPDETGRYQVDFSNSAKQLDLMFISRNHYMVSSSFNRTLGIDAYEFNPVLNEDPMWLENFDYSLKPILSEYIVEKRFNLPDKDQYFLGQWLNQVE